MMEEWLSYDINHTLLSHMTPSYPPGPISRSHIMRTPERTSITDRPSRFRMMRTPEGAAGVCTILPTTSGLPVPHCDHSQRHLDYRQTPLVPHHVDSRRCANYGRSRACFSMIMSLTAHWITRGSIRTNLDVCNIKRHTACLSNIPRP